jgi:hypothetical protein
MPKFVRLSSVETLQSSKKNNYTAIENHEDCDNSKSKTSSKVFFGSPDLLPSGFENLFKSMGLEDNSKSLIISMSYYSIKNMI